MWNLIARLLLAVERSIERQLQPALSGHLFFVKVFSVFVCSVVLVPAMAVAAQAKLFHPVFIVVTEQLANDKPQQAVVEPWFFTDGSRIVWIGTLCAAIAEGRRPPLEARQLVVEGAKWLQNHCGPGIYVRSRFPSSALFGVNNRGESVTLGDLEFEGRSSTFTTSLVSAPGQSAKGRAWNSAFAGLTQGLMGLYVVTTDEALLKRIVPVSRRSATEARRVFDARTADIDRDFLDSWSFCANPVLPQDGCVDGWRRWGVGTTPDGELVSGSGSTNLRQAYFEDLVGDTRSHLLVAVERNVVWTQERAPGKLLAIATVQDEGPVWVRGTSTAGPGIQMIQLPRLSYSMLRYIPRATFALGGCRYVAIALDYDSTQSLDLIVIPGQTKQCRNRTFSQRPATED